MNPKRADLRQHYQNQEAQAVQFKQHQDRTAQLSSFENTVIDAFNMLIRFMDGKVTKTEVTNQLKSISTPDVDKVVIALSKLDADVLSTKVDTKPLEDVLKSIKREVSLIPKQQAKFEQKEAVKVTNLSDINLDTSKLEAAIKALDVAPKVDVKAPIINVDKPDLQPLQSVMLDLLKAVQNQKYPEFPDIPEVDLSKVEKKLDESNKRLKELVDKPISIGGGGGGGGNGTPYQTPDGKASYVALSNGAVPVAAETFATKITTSGTDTYVGEALPGSSFSSAVWRIQKIDAGGNITWKGGSASFTNTATDLTTGVFA